MRKLLVLAVAGLIVATLYLLRGDIAVRLFAAGATSALGDDVLAGLPDGLHVALCGAGGPLADPERAGPCVAVVAGRRLFVVDAGSGGARNLARMGYPAGRIDTVLLTHYHSDHIDGLGELALQRWVQGNHTGPLPVIGPDQRGQGGVAEVVAGFNRAYAQDAAYRNAHHGDTVAPLSGRGMVANGFVLPGPGELRVVHDADGVTVEMLAVDHAPVHPAAGYRFTYKGRTVLISGDTSRSDNLTDFASGVDLLVHDALAPQLVAILNQAATDAGAAGLARITADIPDYHASPLQAAGIAREAGVGHLLLYHVVPPPRLPGLEAAFLDGVEEVFPAHTLGRDGTAFSLPAGSREIILTSRGL